VNAVPTCRLIVYDIRDPKRLGAVYRHLSGLAIRLQYSVFLEVGASLAAQKDLEAQLGELIDIAADDVRIYCLPAECLAFRLGQPILLGSLRIEQEWLREFLEKSTWLCAD
jgi:CRISPR-associated protein Cas2